jgi:hypothetical protein
MKREVVFLHPKNSPQKVPNGFRLNLVLGDHTKSWWANTISGGALMMEVVSTSETSVNFYQTTPRNIPEDSVFT